MLMHNCWGSVWYVRHNMKLMLIYSSLLCVDKNAFKKIKVQPIH